MHRTENVGKEILLRMVPRTLLGMKVTTHTTMLWIPVFPTVLYLRVELSHKPDFP